MSSVRATNPEITMNSDDGNSAYIVRAKQTDVEVDNKGPAYGQLKGMTGVLVEKEFSPRCEAFQGPGQPFIAVLRGTLVASRFSSDEGSIDRNKKFLSMSGNVKITGEDQGLVLLASKVKYDQGRERIEAEGSVTVTSDSRVLGPLPKLVATKDLKRIATPGKFK